MLHTRFKVESPLIEIGSAQEPNFNLSQIPPTSPNCRPRRFPKANLDNTEFLCFQVRSVDPSRLVTPAAGTLPAARMAEVDNALRSALGL